MRGSLALLVPTDYRHGPLLARVREDDLILHCALTGDAEIAAYESYRQDGGVVMRLHRDDQTTKPSIPVQP